MCLPISDGAPTITDWIQALSVPVSLGLSWLIFRLGLSRDSARQLLTYKLESIAACEQKLFSIQEKANRLYLSLQNSAGREEHSYSILNDLDSLNIYLKLLNKQAGTKDPQRFYNLAFNLKESVTGSNTNFLSKKKISQKQQKEIVREIQVHVRNFLDDLSSIKADGTAN